VNADDHAGLGTASSAGSDEVFVVRFWLERAPSESGAALWRGRVSHVNTSQETHVNSLKDAFDFIDDVLARSLDTRHGCRE